jgi:hypothetical protein
VYQLVQDQVSRYLKPLHGDVIPGRTGRQRLGGGKELLLDSLLGYCTKHQDGPGHAQPMGNDAFDNEISRRAIPPSSVSMPAATASDNARPLLRPLSTEDAMAGAPLPSRGFCLRLVTGERDEAGEHDCDFVIVIAVGNVDLR